MIDRLIIFYIYVTHTIKINNLVISTRKSSFVVTEISRVSLSSHIAQASSLHSVILLFHGAISTEHSSSELRVIQTNDHRVNSYFLHFTYNAYPTKPFDVVQLILSPDNP